MPVGLHNSGGGMIYGVVLVVHVLIAIFLIAVILLQGGRGGMGEALGGAAAQSLFGGGANTVMTRLTAICAGFFMVTCLSLAMLSTARGRSIVDQLPVTPDQLPIALPHSTNVPPAPPPKDVVGRPASPSSDQSTATQAETSQPKEPSTTPPSPLTPGGGTSAPEPPPSSQAPADAAR